MNKSDSITDLAVALVMAQMELKNPSFDSQNPHFRNKYASLATVRDTVTPVLAKHGLAVVQLLGRGEGGITCETVLLHTTGQWLSETMYMPSAKQDAQGYGSAATYCRRYSLMAIANVVGDEDDDGQAAVKPKGGVTPGSVTPMAGVKEALSADEQKKAVLVANSVVDLWNADKQFAAYEALYMADYSNEFILGVWDVLQPFSAIRTKLKAMHRDEQAKGKP